MYSAFLNMTPGSIAWNVILFHKFEKYWIFAMARLFYVVLLLNCL